MNKSDVAYLIQESYEQSDEGVLQRSFAKRKVYVRITSVSSSEWFEGGRMGLNPQYRFTVFDGDYKGESMIDYEGLIYSIYRTYRPNKDEVELYTELRKGNDVIIESND